MPPSTYAVRRRLPTGMIPRVAVVATMLAIATIVASFATSSIVQPDRVKGAGKSYGLPAADITMRVRPDGRIDVVERITFEFQGNFQGAYRDIPMRQGDNISDVVVCDSEGSSASEYSSTIEAPDVSTLDPATAQIVLENFYQTFPDKQPGAPDVAGQLGRGCPPGLKAYRPGASTILGSSDTAGSFGTETLTNPDGQRADVPRVQRVVWHYQAFNQVRPFYVAYRAAGWLRASKDGNDLVLTATPWGSEWRASAGAVTATVLLPDNTTLAFGDIKVRALGRGAARVRAGVTNTTPPRLGMRASDVTQGERVELLASFPRAGSGVLASRLTTESRDVNDIFLDADRAQSDSRARESRWKAVRAHWLRTLLLAAAAGTLLAALLAWIGWRRVLAEEPWPDDVPRVLSDPPSDLAPAMAVALVEQRADAAPTALTATVFDLLRQKAWRTLPAQGNEAGARVDIALKPAERPTPLHMSSWEQHVLKLVDKILEGSGEDGVAMGTFKTRLRGDLPRSNKVASMERKFEKALAEQVRSKGWTYHAQTRWTVIPAALSLLGLLGSIPALIFHRPLGWALGTDPRIAGTLAAVLLVLSTGVWLTAVAVSTSRLVRTRWTDASRREAAQWTAYRDYLDNYGDMGDEQTASIEIWERHLVYAVAFGCADDILNAVRPQGVDELQPGMASMRYASFATFSHGLHTRAPQPSDSNGGSSSFSGGGGSFGGGGGGGGGAW